MSKKKKSGKEFPRFERVSESGNSQDFSESLPINSFYFDIVLYMYLKKESNNKAKKSPNSILWENLRNPFQDCAHEIS